MISRKVCLLGAFAVGKTSLVRRFVHEVFDEKYMTTLGVKIDTRLVDLEAESVKLIIWDLEGADPADRESELVNSRMRAYLQGVNAVLLVADGTRPVTLEIALRLNEWLVSEHQGIPAALLLNKSDLTNQWQVDPEILAERFGSLQSFTTSALSGENVERTFQYLAKAMSNGI